jgi:hypothetical protein
LRKLDVGFHVSSDIALLRKLFSTFVTYFWNDKIETHAMFG